MKIKDLEDMTLEQLTLQLQRGGKFVYFQYCISIGVLTFRRGSDIYYIKPGESAAKKAFPYTILSLIVGWWGIPWGPIYTIGALVTNSGGGKDVTAEVLNVLRQGMDASGVEVPVEEG